MKAVTGQGSDDLMTLTITWRLVPANSLKSRLELTQEPI
jgi:hypothetical protein